MRPTGKPSSAFTCSTQVIGPPHHRPRIWSIFLKASTSMTVAFGSSIECSAFSDVPGKIATSVKALPGFISSQLKPSQRKA